MDQGHASYPPPQPAVPAVWNNWLLSALRQDKKLQGLVGDCCHSKPRDAPTPPSESPQRHRLLGHRASVTLKTLLTKFSCCSHGENLDPSAERPSRWHAPPAAEECDHHNGAVMCPAQAPTQQSPSYANIQGVVPCLPGSGRRVPPSLSRQLTLPEISAPKEECCMGLPEAWAPL